ncbi:MAG TPA: hypothetical protein VFG91_03810 [Woeseiaceae bacterium]|nr:hypothetical protein [Woeseiaceae bacterium]
MNSDDVHDIRAGLDCLSKINKSILAAEQAINSMSESHAKRDAEIALQHAQEMSAVAERMFRSALGERSQDEL